MGPGFYLWVSMCFFSSICRELCLPLFVIPDSLIDSSQSIFHRSSSSTPLFHIYYCRHQMIIHSDFLQVLKSSLFLLLIVPHLCVLLHCYLPVHSRHVHYVMSKTPVGKITFSVSTHPPSGCPFKSFVHFLNNCCVPGLC